LEAPADGTTRCSAENFGSRTAGGSCFCELPRPPKHNYCEMPEEEHNEVGCFEDNMGKPDFQKMLSSKLINPEECIQMAFEKNYMYAGLQAGGKCWGSRKKIGKYGSSTQCNYMCPNGKDTCGGKHSNTIFKLAYQKDFLCSIEQKFDEFDSNGKVKYGNGGVLTNPRGDGE